MDFLHGVCEKIELKATIYTKLLLWEKNSVEIINDRL